MSSCRPGPSSRWSRPPRRWRAFGAAPISPRASPLIRRDANPGSREPDAADRSSAQILAAEAVAPALEVADRRRGEMHRAEQRLGLAVALEKAPAGFARVIRVGVGAGEQLGIACL